MPSMLLCTHLLEVSGLIYVVAHFRFHLAILPLSATVSCFHMYILYEQQLLELETIIRHEQRNATELE